MFTTYHFHTTFHLVPSLQYNSLQSSLLTRTRSLFTNQLIKLPCVILVLPEMPLPTPLPQTLSNKSLLFHPRVAEEAQNLLGVRDENLVPQLVHSLIQTSADHMLVLFIAYPANAACLFPDSVPEK